MEKIFFHVDVNNAYLSWEAVYQLQQGADRDLREEIAVIGGDDQKRKGIVLAKSTKAKKKGIKTGESLFLAQKKYPKLIVLPPNFLLYQRYSQAMFEKLREYTDKLMLYSIDEAFLDLGKNFANRKQVLAKAVQVQQEMYQELGFTVNVGISNNKILAKMASGLKKPNMINSLFPEEIAQKMWPLPIGKLFMVGEKMCQKMNSRGISTIGDLARYDLEKIRLSFKKPGEMLWYFARGKDESALKRAKGKCKSISHCITLPEDIENFEPAKSVLLNIAECLGRSLRQKRMRGVEIAVELTNATFQKYSGQRSIAGATDSTKEIYQFSLVLFQKIWRHDPLRKIGIKVGAVEEQYVHQLALFAEEKINSQKLEKVLDAITKKHGEDALVKNSVLLTQINSLTHENNLFLKEEE